MKRSAIQAAKTLALMLLAPPAMAQTERVKSTLKSLVILWMCLTTACFHCCVAAAEAIPRIWVLHDEDPDFTSPPFDDVLSVLDASGATISTTTGFNTCQTIGGNRALAILPHEDAALVCELAAGRMSKVDLQGHRIFSVERSIKAVEVAPDGRVFALEDYRLLRISPVGVIEKEAPFEGFDLVVDPNMPRIYVVGYDGIHCVGYDLSVWWREDPIGWTAVSVDLAGDGSIWVAERQYLPGDGQDRLLHFSRTAAFLHQIPLPFSPFCVRVDRRDDSVYVAGAQLQKYDRTGQLLFSKSLEDEGLGGWSMSIDLSGDVWLGTWTDVRRYSSGGTLLFSSRRFATPSDTWVAMGPGPATGPLSVWIDANFTNVATGYAVSFMAGNTGPILQRVWDFGDGTLLTNQPFASHAWSAPGVYTVQLIGYSDSYPTGVTATVVVTVSAAVYYVDAASSNPISPYVSWSTAAVSIQEAIGVGTLPGRLVLVTNGVYRAGTVEAGGPSRVALTNVVVVRSVNGPEVTLIDGGNEVRCAYVGNGAVLSGFTLTNGVADNGGGASCEVSAVLTNCTVTGNSAEYGGGAYGGTLYNCTLRGNVARWTWREPRGWSTNPGYGGGAAKCTLNNCTLTGNWATDLEDGFGVGGGAAGSTLYNCTLAGNSGSGAAGSALYNCTVTGNSADQYGGGTHSGALYNCIVYDNSGGNYDESTVLNFSCTTPLPTNGVGNIDANPRFVNAAAGDFRLSSDSPCIDAGTNLTDIITNDILGVPRPLDGDGDGIARFDMGAYEAQPYPVIVAQPVNQSVLSGGPLSLSVTATGSLPITYQWQRNEADLSDGGRISGSRTATLTITAVSVEDAGIYSVVVSNAFGDVRSQPVVLDVVIAPPRITGQPQSQAARLGSTVFLDVQATGSRPLVFQWQFNGVVMIDGPRVSGSRASTLQITDLSLGDLGSYSVIVSNAVGWVRSASVELTTSSAVLFAAVEASQVLVTWNDAGKGMTLQRTASLSNPKWENVPGSEGTNRVTLPMTSASEFFRLFRPAPAGLLAWWPGDGNALDVVGGKDGSLRNGATFAPGVVGQAFSFDGVDDYLEVPLLLRGLSEGTVEFWFDVDSWDYTSAPAGIYLWACVAWLPQEPESHDGMNLGTHRGASATGELMFGIFPREVGQWFWAYSGVTPALNAWYHVAGTWGPAGIRIYVNGQLKGTHDYTGMLSSNYVYNVVGCSSWPQSAIQGKVDDLRLFSRALSESEIKAIYEAGGTGKVKPSR